MPHAAPRRALACAVVAACLIAGLFACGNAALAQPRLADEGGRLWRWASGDGAEIVAVAERFLGAGNVTGTRGPWCADFASLVLRKTGHRPLASRMAYAALSYGPHVARPKPGDLVVQGGRHGAQHVGFFVGWVNGAARIVSGNWGHRVALGTLRRSQIIGFVRT